MIINLSRKKSPANISEVKNLTYLNKLILDEGKHSIGTFTLNRRMAAYTI